MATWLAVTGFGIGLALAPAMDAVLGELPRDEAGPGTAVTMTLRQVGGALGVALLGSLSAGVHRNGLDEGVPPTTHDSISGAMAIAARIGDPALALAGGSSNIQELLDEALSVVTDGP